MHNYEGEEELDKDSSCKTGDVTYHTLKLIKCKELEISIYGKIIE
jgi:hypothetical protein